MDLLGEETSTHRDDHTQKSKLKQIKMKKALHSTYRHIEAPPLDSGPRRGVQVQVGRPLQQISVGKYWQVVARRMMLQHRVTAESTGCRCVAHGPSWRGDLGLTSKDTSTGDRYTLPGHLQHLFSTTIGKETVTCTMQAWWNGVENARNAIIRRSLSPSVILK